MSQNKSKLRRALSRWADSEEALARELRATPSLEGDITLADAVDRERVSVRGTIKTVMLRPRGGVPALEAELDDGTGVLAIVWLGRRRIAGIEPGRSMRVQGRIGSSTGTRLMFNPRYELIP